MGWSVSFQPDNGLFDGRTAKLGWSVSFQPDNGLFKDIGGSAFSSGECTATDIPFWEQRILRFEYAYVGLPALDGEQYATGTALYHSGVNFTTLGYGDIVMSDTWRLLGPLEAANGVLMCGVSASGLFAVTNRPIKMRLVRDEHG